MAFDDADWGVGVEEKINLAPTEEKGEIVIDINSPETITTQLRKGLNNTPTRLGFYDGTAWRSYITADGKFKFEGNGTNYIEWNGTSLNVTGSISITNPSDVRTELNVADGATNTTNTNQLTDGANLGQTATWSNVTGTGKPEDGADVTSNNTSNNTNNVGNKTSSNVQGSVDKTDLGLNTSGEISKAVKGSNLPLLTPTVAGLYMDSSRMGYHNGTSWTNYISSDGFFKVGSGINYIEYNPNTDTTTFTGEIIGSDISGSTITGQVFDVGTDLIIRAGTSYTTQSMWAGGVVDGYSASQASTVIDSVGFNVHLPNTPILPSGSVRLRSTEGSYLIFNPPAISGYSTFKMEANNGTTIGAPTIVVKYTLRVHDYPFDGGFSLTFGSNTLIASETVTHTALGITVGGLPVDEISLGGLKLKNSASGATSGGYTQASMTIDYTSQLDFTDIGAVEGYIVICAELISTTDPLYDNILRANSGGSMIVSNI